MRVLPINSCYSQCKNVKSSQNKQIPRMQSDRTSEVSSDSVSFRANYLETFKKCLERPVTYDSIIDMGVQLYYSAKLEAGLTKHPEFKFIFEDSSIRDFVPETLSKTKYRFGDLEEVMLTSSNHSYPLITACKNYIFFRNPDSSRYRDGSIVFYLDDDKYLAFERPDKDNRFHSETWSFYDNKQLREYYAITTKTGEMVEQKKFTPDGERYNLLNRLIYFFNSDD